ncbi:MAG: hypothetical protein ACRER0_00295 [Gammaproteobacteria bacterium]
MIKRVTVIIIFIACAAVTGLIIWIASAYLTTRSLETQFAGIELSEIAHDVRASGILNQTNVADDKEFDKLFFTKVLTIAIFRPEVSKLGITHLKTLCRLIVYKQDGGFGDIKDSPMKEIVFTFLDSQRNVVIEQLRQRQQNFLKARQDLVTEHVITPEYLKKIESRAQENVTTSDLCTQ